MHHTRTILLTLSLLLAILAARSPLASAPQMAPVQPGNEVSRFALIRDWNEVAAGYVGCFRAPGAGGVLNYGGYGLTMGGPNSLFLTVEASINGGFVAAEIGIPADIAPASTLSGCAAAPVIQSPVDVWEGKFTQLADPSVGLQLGHVNLWGLLAVDSQLCMVGGINYDASDSGKRSAFCRSRNLASRGTVSNAMHLGTGTYRYVSQGREITDEKPGYTFGYMGWVPVEWRFSLGADACAGGTGKNITFRQSQGPALTCFQTSDLLRRTPDVPAQFLLNYPYEQREMGERMLGWWQGSALPAPGVNGMSIQYDALWNGTGRINGFAWPNRSRTIMFIGSMGIGEWCYKDCPNHPVMPTSPRPDGSSVINGHHAEPDTYRVWFYDALDLVKVRRGELRPWKVMPYRVENITLPGPTQRVHSIRSAIVDPVTNRLFVAQYADTYTQGGAYVDSPPVIHVYQLQGR